MLWKVIGTKAAIHEAMKEYISIADEDIDLIFANFDIGEKVNYRLLHGGSENTNILITTTRNKYVLTICEQKTKEQTFQLVNLLSHLKNHGFKTSEIIAPNNGEPVLKWNQKPVFIKSFLDGQILDEFSFEVLQKIGMEMGKLHEIPCPDYLPRQLSFGRKEFQSVSKYASGSNFEKWLIQKTKLISQHISEDLPRALIHTDIFDNNVVVDHDSNGVTLFDFEEASNYFRIFDIGMAIIGTCSNQGEVSREKVHALLSGYVQSIILTDNELKCIKWGTVYAGTAMTFWRHQNFNYVNPTPKMFDHYQALQRLTDYAEKQSEEFFMLN